MQYRVKKLLRFALLSALSITFFIVDSFLPKPLPFMKYGIANIFVLVLVYDEKYKIAVFVMVFKIIFGNFFTGKLFSAVALLSISGGIFALTFMILFRQILRNLISITGYSLIGSFAHVLGQLIALKLTIIHNINILFFYKIFWITTLISGVLIGYAAEKIRKSIIFKI